MDLAESRLCGQLPSWARGRNRRIRCMRHPVQDSMGRSCHDFGLRESLLSGSRSSVHSFPLASGDWSERR